MADNSFKINKSANFNPQPGLPANPVDGDFYYDGNVQSFVYFHNGKFANMDSVGIVAVADPMTSAQFTPAVVQNSVVKITGGVSPTHLTGISSSFSAKRLTIYNAGTSYITVEHEDPSESTANNRIHTPTAGDMNLIAGEVAVFTYDIVVNRWLLVSISSQAGAQLIATTSSPGLVTLHQASLFPFDGIVLSDGDLNTATGVVGLDIHRAALINSPLTSVTALVINAAASASALVLNGGAGFVSTAIINAVDTQAGLIINGVTGTSALFVLTSGLGSGNGITSIGTGGGTGVIAQGGSVSGIGITALGGATGDGIHGTGGLSGGYGIVGLGTTTFSGIKGSGGSGTSGIGIEGIGGSAGGVGVTGNGGGSSGVGGAFTGGSAADGLTGLGGSGARGGTFTGGSNGDGVGGIGTGTGSGGFFTGNGGHGITSAALSGNKNGGLFTGFGSGNGIFATGGLTGAGVIGHGGATGGFGGSFTGGAGGGAGVVGTGGGTDEGVAGLGNGGHGVTGIALSGNKNGGLFSGSGSGTGITAIAGDTGAGGSFTGGGTSGNGITSVGSANSASFGIQASGGAAAGTIGGKFIGNAGPGAWCLSSLTSLVALKVDGHLDMSGSNTPLTTAGDKRLTPQGICRGMTRFTLTAGAPPTLVENNSFNTTAAIDSSSIITVDLNRDVGTDVVVTIGDTQATGTDFSKKLVVRSVTNGGGVTRVQLYIVNTTTGLQTVAGTGQGGMISVYSFN